MFIHDLQFVTSLCKGVFFEFCLELSIVRCTSDVWTCDFVVLTRLPGLTEKKATAFSTAPAPPTPCNRRGLPAGACMRGSNNKPPCKRSSVSVSNKPTNRPRRSPAATEASAPHRRRRRHRPQRCPLPLMVRRECPGGSSQDRLRQQQQLPLSATLEPILPEGGRWWALQQL